MAEIVENKYVTTGTAAKYLGVSATTLSNWLKGDLIAHMRVPFGNERRTFLVDVEDLKRFETELRHEAKKRRPGRPRLDKET